MQGESRSVDCVFCFFERVMPHVEEGSSIGPWRRLVLETLPHLRHQRWSQSKRGKFGCKWVTAFMAGNISRVQWRKVWHFVQMRDLGDYSLKYNKQHIWQIWFLKMSSELPHVLPPSSIVIIHQLETSAVLCIIQTVKIVKKKMENLTNCAIGLLESFHMQNNPDQLLVSDKLSPSASCGCASVSWARFPNHYFW